MKKSALITLGVIAITVLTVHLTSVDKQEQGPGETSSPTPAIATAEVPQTPEIRLLKLSETSLSLTANKGSLNLPQDISIEIFNDTSEPIVLTNFTTSCSCLEVVHESVLLEPNNSGAIHLKMIPAKLGKHRFAVDFSSHAPNETIERSINLQHSTQLIPPETWIDAAKVADPLSSFLIVDLRSQKEFLDFRIPQARRELPVNLPNDVTPVLVFAAFPSPHDLRQAEPIRQRYPDTSILAGGMHAWVSSEYDLVGRATSDPSNGAVTPQLLLAAIPYRPVLWVHRDLEAGLPAIPDAIEVKSFSDHRAIIADNSRPAFMITPPNAKTSTPSAPVPPLRGGVPQLAQALRMRQLLQTSVSASSTSTIGGTASARPVAGGGCATCP